MPSMTATIDLGTGIVVVLVISFTYLIGYLAGRYQDAADRESS